MFRNNIFCFLFILLSLNTISIYGQNCNHDLSIEVLDLHDGTPLSNAIVVINELQIQRTTNLQGKLIFNRF